MKCGLALGNVTVYKSFNISPWNIDVSILLAGAEYREIDSWILWIHTSSNEKGS